MTDTYAAVIDLADVERCFPDGHSVPALIVEIANLIAPWPHASVGHARMKGSRFDNY
jgi:hypothetical protein